MEEMPTNNIPLAPEVETFAEETFEGEVMVIPGVNPFGTRPPMV